MKLKDKLLTENYSLPQSSGNINPVLKSYRENALAALKNKGFPEKKDEDYKYFNLEPIKSLEISEKSQITPLYLNQLAHWSDKESYLVVLVNGIFNQTLSRLENLPNGVRIQGLSEAFQNKDLHALSTIGTIASSDTDSFLAMNSALFEDGIYIFIPDYISLAKPIHILDYAAGSGTSFSNPRNLIIMGENSGAKIIQSFLSDDFSGGFTNSTTEISQGKNSNLEWVCIEQQGNEHMLINNTLASLSHASVLKAFSFSLGGKLVRNNLRIYLDESNSETHLWGYYHPKNGQTFDNQTFVDHRKPHCRSNELYKGVIGEDATANFNGKILVREHAQKTNAFQSNKNILLSESASINTKPQLEIYADDVKCSHGSSTGNLNPEELFYLRSRGISMEKARKLLLSAYVSDILNHLSIETLKQYMEDQLHKRID